VVPDWVLDAVIVHELAHLFEHRHNARFRQLENRYPRRREADLFLDGYSLGLHMSDAGDDEDPEDEDSGTTEGTDTGPLAGTQVTDGATAC
jgi:hypothetical protein